MPYTIYTAGGMFSIHELATNVFVKEAVWLQSKGKFKLILPQSEQPEDYEHSDLSVQIRNLDYLHVIQTDILLARFDGLELDAGTVAEFMMAKFLGKPAVILRCDSRRMSNDSFDEPYNLMVKNWPRTVVVHADSLERYMLDIAPESNDVPGLSGDESVIKGECFAAQRGIAHIAEQIIQGFEQVLQMPSPFPEEIGESLYHAARLMPGSGFDALVTPARMQEIIASLRANGTF